jgi:hypothetical protein
MLRRVAGLVALSALARGLEAATISADKYQSVAELAHPKCREIHERQLI